MKILHVVSKFAGGGLERRAIQTVKGLCGHPEIEQQIVVLSNQIEYREILSLPVKIHYLNDLVRKDRIFALKDVVSVFRPDIVHSWLDHYPTDQVYMSLMKYVYGYKYIHGAVCDANRVKRMTTVWLGQKVSFICADAVVSNSQAGLIAKKAPQKKSVVIYNGFDFGRIPQILNHDKKKEIGVDTKYIVTMCGRIDGSKDWDSFIEVARLASEENIDVTFVAIGNGSMIDNYRDEVFKRGLNNIIFLGRRTDVEELIGLSDVCILLSNKKTHAEGVSNFIMESMASAKPVIATCDGGTPEIVRTGVCGYVVEDNVYDAYKLLKDLLSDETKRVKYGEEAKKEIMNRFTLSQMTDNYLNLYHRLIIK